MKRSIPDTKYDSVIKLLTKVMSLFNTDHLRLVIEAQGLEERTDNATTLESLEAPQHAAFVVRQTSTSVQTSKVTTTSLE